MSRGRSINHFSLLLQVLAQNLMKKNFFEASEICSKRLFIKNVLVSKFERINEAVLMVYQGKPRRKALNSKKSLHFTVKPTKNLLSLSFQNEKKNLKSTQINYSINLIIIQTNPLLTLIWKIEIRYGIRYLLLR